jgi:predicted metal-binding membrane protein
MTHSASVRGSRFDRTVVLAGVLGVAALAWIYLLRDAAGMQAMSMAGGMPAAQVWTPGWLVSTFVMWAVMMAAMMLPSAAPAILMHSAMSKGGGRNGIAQSATWLFTAGYLAVWTVFSAMVTILQAGLQSSFLVSPMMASGSHYFSGLLLVAAGIYQWTPWKDACLKSCQNPLQFFLFRWRPGPAGAFHMGMEHGALCAGCCWAIMLLLFVAGVMNLLWVALITAFVLVEKLLPFGKATGRVTGLALIAWGVGINVI